MSRVHLLEDNDIQGCIGCSRCHFAHNTIEFTVQGTYFLHNCKQKYIECTVQVTYFLHNCERKI
jgi:hypothetical protein